MAPFRMACRRVHGNVYVYVYVASVGVRRCAVELELRTLSCLIYIMMRGGRAHRRNVETIDHIWELHAAPHVHLGSRRMQARVLHACTYTYA